MVSEGVPSLSMKLVNHDVTIGLGFLVLLVVSTDARHVPVALDLHL